VRAIRGDQWRKLIDFCLRHYLELQRVFGKIGAILLISAIG